MGWSILSGANGHTSASAAGSSAATTPAIDTTGADTIFVISGTDQSVPSVITDSKSNTWTATTHGQYVDATTTAGIQIWFAKGAISGTSHTFTNTAFNPTLAVIAFSGGNSNPFDVENGNGPAGTANTAQPGSVTPSQDNELQISGYSTTSSNGGFVSVDSGFSKVEDVDSSFATGYPITAGYNIQGTAAAINPTWKWTNTVGVVLTIASFKAAAAASATVPVNSYYQSIVTQ